MPMPMPAELRALQWIDCSRDFELGYMDVLLALDRLGLRVPTRPTLPGFDWKHVLARAVRNQQRPGEQLFRVGPSTYYSLALRNVLVAVAAAILAVGLFVANAPYRLAGIALVVATLSTLLSAVLYYRYYAGALRAEMIVTSAEGVILRQIRRRERWFAFGELWRGRINMKAIPYRGVTDLRLAPPNRSGRPTFFVSQEGSKQVLRVTIGGRFEQRQRIADQIVADERADAARYRAAPPQPAALPDGAPDSAAADRAL